MTLQNNHQDPVNSSKTSLPKEERGQLSENALNKVTGGDADSTRYTANCPFCGWYWPSDTFDHTSTQVILHNALGGGHNAVIKMDPVQN